MELSTFVSAHRCSAILVLIALVMYFISGANYQEAIVWADEMESRQEVDCYLQAYTVTNTTKKICSNNDNTKCRYKVYYTLARIDGVINSANIIVHDIIEFSNRYGPYDKNILTEVNKYDISNFIDDIGGIPVSRKCVFYNDVYFAKYEKPDLEAMKSAIIFYYIMMWFFVAIFIVTTILIFALAIYYRNRFWRSFILIDMFICFIHQFMGDNYLRDPQESEKLGSANSEDQPSHVNPQDPEVPEVPEVPQEVLEASKSSN